jgi:hypothetical protein
MVCLRLFQKRTFRIPLSNDAARFTDQCHVRFGSLADICSAKGHVRFAPKSDRENGFPQTVMSALPPKADMCSATRDVRFGPKADSCTAAKQHRYSSTSSARVSNCDGIIRPSDRALLRLITSSNLTGSSIGRSPGFAPFRILSTYFAERR